MADTTSTDDSTREDTAPAETPEGDNDALYRVLSAVAPVISPSVVDDVAGRSFQVSVDSSQSLSANFT